MATVRQWIASKSVTQEDLDKSMEELAKVSASDPANAEAPYYLGKTKIQQGINQLADKRPDQAAVIFGEAAEGLKKVLAGQEKNATLQYNAYELFLRLARFDPKAEERKHRENAGKCIAAAFKAINDKTTIYDRI